MAEDLYLPVYINSRHKCALSYTVLSFPVWEPFYIPQRFEAKMSLFGVINRGKYIVVCFWVSLFVVGIYYAPKFMNSTVESFYPPKDTAGYKSQKILERVFPGESGNTLLIIYFEALKKDTYVLGEYTKEISLTLNTTFREMAPDVIDSIEGYYVSDIGLLAMQFVTEPINPKKSKAMIMTVSLLHHAESSVTPLLDLAKKMQDMVTRLNSRDDEYFMGVTGQMAMFKAVKEESQTDLEKMDMFILPAALLILALVLRSLKLMVSPVISVIFSIVVSYAAMYPVTKYLLSVQTYASNIMMSLVVACSIDYSLFLLTRYREETFNKRGNDEAVRIMFKEAGKIVVTSGCTLAISFIGLTLLPVTSLRSLGVAASMAIVVTLLVNMTLTPALLLILGKHLQSFFKIDLFASKENKEDMQHLLARDVPVHRLRQLALKRQLQSWWYKSAKITTNKFGAVIVIAVILAMAIPIAYKTASMKTTMDNGQIIPRDAIASKTFLRMKNSFSPGLIGSYFIMFLTPENNGVLHEDFFQRTQAVIHEVLHDTAIPEDSVTGISYAIGNNLTVKQANSYLDKKNKDDISRLYRYMWRTATSDDNSSAIFNIKTPFDPLGDHAKEFILKVRKICDSYDVSGSGSVARPRVYFNGGCVNELDAVNAIFEAFPLMICLTAGAVFFLMSVVFKSFVIPLKMIFTISLTLMWIYGASVLVFELGFMDWAFEFLKASKAVYFIVPVLSFSILVGLGLDYDIFLVCRIAEYRDAKYTDRASIVKGVYRTGGVITSAGVIMFVAFFGLLLSQELMLVQIGFMLCFAVLIDTFIVRTILVPAAMTLLGKINWWPGKKPVATKDERNMDDEIFENADISEPSNARLVQGSEVYGSFNHRTVN